MRTRSERRAIGRSTAGRNLFALGIAGVVAVAAIDGFDAVRFADATGSTMAIAAIDPDLLADSRPSISDDGDFLVTQAVSDGRATVMLSDLGTREEIELTTPPASARAGHSVMPLLSADGCTVTVMTEMALDPFRDDDTAERWDLYQLLLPACGGRLGAWELVSSTEDGSARDDLDPAEAFSVSATGSQVAFVHPGPGDVTAISIADLTRPSSAQDRIIAVTPVDGGPAGDTLSVHRGLGEPSLSADGRRLAFTAELIRADDPTSAGGWVWAEAAEPGGAPPRQVLVWYRPAERSDDQPVETGRFEAVTVRSDGSMSTGAETPILSGDGAVVVFVSTDTELVDAQYPPCRDGICPRQIVAVGLGRDGDTSGDTAGDTADDTADDTAGDRVGGLHQGSIRLVSAVRGDDGGLIAGDRSSWLGHVNLDGSQVVFVTRAGNLSEVAVSAGGDAGDGDLYLADLGLDDVVRVTDLVAAGVPAAHSNPRFSASGRRLVFDTLVGHRLGAAAAGVAAPIDEFAAVEQAPEAVDAAVDGGVDEVAGERIDQAAVSGVDGEPTIGVTAFEPTTPAPESGTPTRSVISITSSPKVSIPDLDFGSVVAGLPSDERFVRVRNEGPGVFRPDTISTTDRRFIVTDNGTCRRGLVVSAGSACTVTVVFRPDGNDAFAAELVVAEDPAGADAAVVARATLSGAGGEPVIRVDPVGVDLGEVVIGAVDDDGELLPAPFDTFEFMNVGEVWMNIAEVSVSNPDFVVFSQNCTGRTIGPAGRCEVAVAYRPTSSGTHAAVVRVMSSNQQYAAAVLSASAVYRPVVETFADSLPAGAPIGVSLAGFAADSDVVVGLSDRPDSWVGVRTDAAGRAMVMVETRRLERSGRRTVVAIGAENLRASTTIDIHRDAPDTIGLPGFGYGFSGR
jgi:Tol biopolymer transport system component